MLSFDILKKVMLILYRSMRDKNLYIYKFINIFMLCFIYNEDNMLILCLIKLICMLEY